MFCILHSSVIFIIVFISVDLTDFYTTNQNQMNEINWAFIK